MNYSKKLLALLLTLALLVSFMPQTSAKAATKTQKETLLTGEVVNYTALLGTIKSVSSSKKAVATVKKKNGKAVVTAKKAGKAVITIKSTRGTNKIKITVKKRDITCKLQALSNGYALISVKNNTSIFMDSATVNYTLRNPEGEKIDEATRTVSHLMPKKTAYYRVYYNNYNYTLSIENSSVSIEGESRSLSAKYKSRISTTKVTATENTEEQKLSLKIKNNYSGAIQGTIDVFYYDENGTMIDYSARSVYLKGNESTTDTFSTPYEGYASYKTAIRTYSRAY